MAFWQHLNGRRLAEAAGGLAVIAIIAFGVSWLGANTSRGDRSAADAAVPVTAVVATVSNVPNLIGTIGTVQSIDTIAIQSQVNGPIMKIEFSPGQDVKKGQELFLIDPRPYQAAVDQEQAQLTHDEAVLKEAEIDLQRYQTLAKQHSIAVQQAQDQAYVVEQDKGTVQVDQANLFTAQINLEYCHIKAPVEGRVGILLVDLGNLVGPSITSQTTTSGTTSTTGATSGAAGQTGTSSGLVSLSQMKPIYVSFPVPQTELDEVRKSQAAGPLEVDAYSQAGKLIEKGKLTVIDNQVNASAGTVTMQGTFANSDDALWPGEFVTIRLIIGIRHDAVTVPAQAVMEGPDGSYLYVIGAEQKVHRSDVRVAAQQNGRAVIEAGVAAGQQVVSDGQYRLANGVKVAIQHTAAAQVGRQ
jgi:multidrug efflux system membrane fusion protein